MLKYTNILNPLLKHVKIEHIGHFKNAIKANDLSLLRVLEGKNLSPKIIFKQWNTFTFNRGTTEKNQKIFYFLYFQWYQQWYHDYM